MNSRQLKFEKMKPGAVVYGYVKFLKAYIINDFVTALSEASQIHVMNLYQPECGYRYIFTDSGYKNKPGGEKDIFDVIFSTLEEDQHLLIYDWRCLLTESVGDSIRAPYRQVAAFIQRAIDRKVHLYFMNGNYDTGVQDDMSELFEDVARFIKRQQKEEITTTPMTLKTLETPAKYTCAPKTIADNMDLIGENRVIFDRISTFFNMVFNKPGDWDDAVTMPVPLPRTCRNCEEWNNLELSITTRHKHGERDFHTNFLSLSMRILMEEAGFEITVDEPTTPCLFTVTWKKNDRETYSVSSVVTSIVESTMSIFIIGGPGRDNVTIALMDKIDRSDEKYSVIIREDYLKGTVHILPRIINTNAVYFFIKLTSTKDLVDVAHITSLIQGTIFSNPINPPMQRKLIIYTKLDMTYSIFSDSSLIKKTNYIKCL